MKRVILIIAIAVIYIVLLAGFSSSRAQQPNTANGLHKTTEIGIFDTKTGWDPLGPPPFPWPWPKDTNQVAIYL